MDFSDDAQISATLERELEEELFGRGDVDTTERERRHGDPFHLSRLSEPMRWLIDHSGPEHWRIECTGVGFNLVSGNFEFAALVVIALLGATLSAGLAVVSLLPSGVAGAAGAGSGAYWLASADGRIYRFGAADFGSMRSI